MTDLVAKEVTLMVICAVMVIDIVVGTMTLEKKLDDSCGDGRRQVADGWALDG